MKGDFQTFVVKSYSVNRDIVDHKAFLVNACGEDGRCVQLVFEEPAALFRFAFALQSLVAPSVQTAFEKAGETQP